MEIVERLKVSKAETSPSQGDANIATLSDKRLLSDIIEGSINVLLKCLD
jgi:hypothetical protein